MMTTNEHFTRMMTINHHWFLWWQLTIIHSCWDFKHSDDDNKRTLYSYGDNWPSFTHMVTNNHDFTYMATNNHNFTHMVTINHHLLIIWQITNEHFVIINHSFLIRLRLMSTLIIWWQSTNTLIILRNIYWQIISSHRDN